MFYLVQENLFKEENYHLIFKTLDRLGLEYEKIECLPFVDDLKFETKRKDVFCFGSVKMAKLATKEGFYPGSFFGGNHDFEIYSKHYMHHLINYPSIVQHYTKDVDFEGSLKFIRPTKDSKIFTGQVFSKVEWEDLLYEKVKPYLSQDNIVHDFNGMIQISEPKTIFKEARVWIIDGNVVTSSYYRFHHNATYEDRLSYEGLEFAQEMADLYQVADAFVMDICYTPDGWKIVEINCINCAGFYKGDLQKIIIALENKYGLFQ